MSLSRRNFLGGLVAAGTAGAVASTAKASTKHFEGHPDSYGILHDTTLCVGCRSCEVACNKVNELPAQQWTVGDKAPFEKLRRTTPESLTVVNRYKQADGSEVFRKHQCMHCQEPCCASVCLVRAFSKTPQGPVLYDPDVCIGCRYCVMACPYYALSYDYGDPLTPQVRRCTMCYPRILEGKQPGCTDACPNGAIIYGKRKELLQVARDRVKKKPENYLNHIFGEHEYGGTSWLLLSGITPDLFGLPDLVSAPHTPLPEIGTSFLSVVPLVVTIYPGLLAGFYAFSKRKEKISEEKARAAVVEALLKADEETKAKLAAAASRATKDKEKAIAAAVKKALTEVEKKAKEGEAK